jgi:initiation factor 1A
VPRQEGTYYGRVLRNLGHMNMLVYCNDGKQRVCHIRGAMRRRVWVNIGDIVLASSREYEIGMNTQSGEEKGDIVHKYDVSDHNRLKADPVFNPILLVRLEQQADLNNIRVATGGGGGGAGAGAGAGTTYAFHDGEDEEEGTAAAAAEDDPDRSRYKAAKSRAEEERRTTGLQKKMGGGGGGDDDDIDIDAI